MEYFRAHALWLLGGVAWAVSLGAGIHALVRFEYTVGPAATAPLHWPGETQIPRRERRFSLVMFAHPDCSCTRASLAEIDTLPDNIRDQLDAFLEIRKPGLSARDARNSQLWRDASTIRGLTLSLDEHGRETRIFGAAVSGQTLLYDQAGDLVFSGGVTLARGHLGENVGIQAVLARVAGSPEAAAVSVDRTPVFGCSLRDPTQTERASDSSWKMQ